MSYPNATTIENISYSNLNYLTDTYTTKITENDFDLKTGKPLNNIRRNSKVSPFFLNVVANSLSERVGIDDSFVYKYPQVLELDSMRDLQITEETTISAVFVMDGALMRNMFGYYFYKIDDSGNKVLLDNDGEVKDYYYRPTVVFPNVTCEPEDSTTLQQGDSRVLRGNLPNGNFENICIGFFLISFGWYAFITNTTVNDKRILYSTVDFNNPCPPTPYQFVNDKIYSVYAKATNDENQELLLVAFEDTFFSGIDDLDYNDCVIGLEISDITHIVDYDKFAEIVFETKPTRNNIVHIDDNGEFINIDTNVYNITKNDYVFERHMRFTNKTNRDNFYTIYNKMLLNYKLSITKVDNEDGTYDVVATHLFRKNDLTFNKDKNNIKLYLIKLMYNTDDKLSTRSYSDLYEDALQSGQYREYYRFYQAGSREYLIDLTDDIDSPNKDSNNTFRVVGSGLMDCNNGKGQIPFSNPVIYNVYKNMTNSGIGLSINIKMDTHPTRYMDGHKYFVRYISFVVDTTNHIVIDLADLSVWLEQDDKSLLPVNMDDINTTLSGIIRISDITSGNNNVKDLVSIFKNDKYATYRLITIKNNMQFYCIRLPSIKNNPTLIYLDSAFVLNWVSSVSILGGTYYDDKKRYYVVNSFKSIGSTVRDNTHGSDNNKDKDNKDD